MKTIKKVIICIAIVIIIILIAIVAIKKKEQNKVIDKYGNHDESGIVINYEIEDVINETKFYTVSNCIQKYIDSISEKDEKAIYNMLSKEYIADKRITNKNVIQNVPMIEEQSTFIAKEMKVFGGNEIEVYSVYGKLFQKDNVNISEDIYFIVKMDETNFTFNINPQIDKNIKTINDIKIMTETEKIEKNDNNTFEYIRISTEDVIRNYFTDYKRNVIYDVESAYKSLDEEYRNKRFGSLENYEKYVKENIDLIRQNILDNYQINEKENYNQYVCTDKNGNNYIFKENAIMKYSLILDTYTIDLPEFLEKYNSTTDQGKVALNIQKFMQSINAKDYNYAYNCLSDGFRNNYFKTLESFKEYITQNLYSNNKVEYLEFNKENLVYTYKIQMKNNENLNSQEILKTFIVKLGEETDFELSFNVE